MSIAYRTKVNKRPVGGEVPISSEQHTVGISGAFTSTPDRIRLVEVPLKEQPISSVIIPGYSEVDINGPAPTMFQFAVDYSLGHVIFHASQNGNTVFVSYKGRGSEVDSEDVNELQIPVGTALNSDGSLVAGIVHPNNISTVITDDFVLPRDLTVTRNLIVNNTISEGDGTLTINTAETGAPTLNAQFVVARGSSTPVSLRWNETLDAWEFVDNVTPIFQFFNSGAFSLTGPIQIADGSAAIPAYSFSSDTDTGLYHSVANQLDVSVGGTNTVIFSTAALTSTVPYLTQNGTAAAPAFSFSSDSDTGMYHIGANDLGFSTNGILQLAISTTTLTSQLPISVFTSSGGTSATFTDSVNSTLRIKHPLSNVLAFDVDASNFFKLTVADSEIARFTTTQALFKGGSTLVPGISFLTEPASGISLPFTKTLAFSLDGIGEVARFTPAGDFQILEGEKIIMDGIGNAYLRFTTATSMYGQTDTATGAFEFGSANSLILFSNSDTGGPILSLLTDGTATLTNATQGTTTDRALKLEISQQFASGYHRTFQLFPSDGGLGTAATGNATVVNYAALTGAVLTVNGTTLTEGIQWTASVNNNTTATSLASAIILSGVASGVAVGNVVNITATTPGVAGNSITLTTSDAVNLTVSGATLTGGTDDFVIAMGYKANGTTITAGTIDTHNSYPLIVTVNDTEMMEVNSVSVDMRSHKITNVADPVSDTDAANKRYVNNVAAGLDPKAASTAATTASLSVTPSGSGVGKLLTATGNGLLTTDGYSTWIDMDNDGGVNDPFSTSTKASRVLVKNQGTAKDNGIYAVKDKGSVSTPFILVRAVDFDGSPSNEVSGGDFTFIEEGTTLANTGWVVVSTTTITVDTDAINWSQFSAGAIPVVASDPASPAVGQIWFNTTDNQFKGQNNSSTVIIG